MVVGLIALLLGIRSMGASSTAAPAPPAAQPAQQTEPVAVAPQAREPLGAPLPAEPAPVPTARIRFSSRPIEPSYTVVANDNLWSIAQKNRTTVEALQSINNLPERATLHIGQKLVIP